VRPHSPEGGSRLGWIAWITSIVETTFRKVGRHSVTAYLAQSERCDGGAGILACRAIGSRQEYLLHWLLPHSGAGRSLRVKMRNASK
jgi:hypothetical protein